MVKDELRCNTNRRVQLFFSNKTVDSIPFFDDLDACQSAHRSVKIYHYITRQHDVPANMKKGRIDLDQCVSALPNEVAYLVCGSADFVRDMWRGLVERGVDGGSISTETFFE